MNAPPLAAHQAESSALKLKWVRRDGRWVTREYILTRTPDGKLSDHPVNNEAAK